MIANNLYHKIVDILGLHNIFLFFTYLNIRKFDPPSYYLC